MKKIPAFIFTSLLLTGCNFLNFKKNETNITTNKEIDQENHEHDWIISYDDYGAFLGRNENNITGFYDYNYLSFEFDEFSDQNIQNLNNKNIKTFAYLNVGSLENYRYYYDNFKNITIGEYENWEDEAWINVSNVEWQNFIVNTVAKGLKNRGAFGVYMDNVDVYTFAKENKLNFSNYATGLKNIIKGVSDLGLKVMINGGSEFLDDMNDKNDSIFDSIWGYHQEEVFSLIEDYDRNIFTTQNSEDSSYYKETLKMMHDKNKNLFLLEYTKNEALKEKIKRYCEENNIHFYIADSVELD